jgi:hypothetical protein
MRGMYVMVANYAEVTPRSTLNIVGGEWEQFEMAAVPGTFAGYVAGVVALEPEDLGTGRDFGLVMSDAESGADLSKVLPVHVSPRAPAIGVDTRAPFAVRFSLDVEHTPRIVKVRVVDGEGFEMASTSFRIH